MNNILDIIKEFFANPAQYFAAMDSDQSLIALGLALLLYWLGIWTGWLIWGRLARRRMKVIRKLESDYNTLDAQHKVLLGQHEQAQKDLEELQTAKAELDEALSVKQREVRAAHEQLAILQDENVSLKSDLETYLKKIDVLDTQMMNLSTKNAQLEEELEATGNTMNSLAAVQSSFNSTRDRLTVVEARITDLMSENQDLRVELTRIKDVPPTPTYTDPIPAVPPVLVEMDEELVEEEEEITDTATLIANARLAVQQAIGTKISIASIDEKDDLQQIDGVGPFIENQLNELGIYTFEQICQWDDALIEQVTTAIEFFPGRIQKDDWKGQACKLKSGTKASQKTTGGEELEVLNLVKSKSTPKKYKDSDLKIIEGIGPKIEKLLKDAGIKNWSDLAVAKVDYLTEILTTAGGSYRLAVPNTWPKQAELAASGAWDELEKYQDYLDGGKEPKK